MAHIQSLKQLREKIVRWKGQQSGDEDGSSSSDSNGAGENSTEEKVADPDYKLEKIRPKTKDLVMPKSSLDQKRQRQNNANDQH